MFATEPVTSIRMFAAPMGQRVARAPKIGLMGTSGHSTGGTPAKALRSCDRREDALFE